MNSLRHWILPFLSVLLVAGSAAAESTPPSSRQQAVFEEALRLVEAFSNDSANLVLGLLLDELSQSGHSDTEFGLRVQMRRAEVLLKDDKEEIAFKALLHVKEESKQKEYWEIYAHAHIIQARMHEKFNRWKQCKENLEAARSVIKAHHLQQLHARLYMRLSSYYRFEGQLDSAIVCAELAAKIAPEYSQTEYWATANLLLGHLKRVSTPLRSIPHYLNASDGYERIGNHSHNIFPLHSLAVISMLNREFRKALSYNDAAVASALRAQAQGHTGNYFFPSTYEQRADIFQALDQLDSTIYYLKMSHEYRLEQHATNDENRLKILEASYDAEKKAQQLKERELEVNYERNQRNGFIILFLIVLLFAAVLYRFYLKLKRANHKMKRQAQIIKQTNLELQQALEQQIMLQGEIHHRVKNNLQVIISLLDLQREDIQDAQAMASLDAMSNRIYSMAAIHEVLYQKEGSGVVSLEVYTQHLCEHFRGLSAEHKPPVFHLHFDNQCLNLDTLMPLGIMINELMTNSFKYGQLPGKTLEISIGLEACADGYCLVYSDNGLGFPAGMLKEREGGLGSYLLRSMCRQLEGKLESYNAGGAVCKIFFKEKNRQVLNGATYSYN